MNTNVAVGVPIVIPEYIKEYDEDGELISEIIKPESFEGNYIASWSDNDGSEGLIVDGVFDSGEDPDGFFIEIPELNNIVAKFFNNETLRVVGVLEENNISIRRINDLLGDTYIVNP